MPKLSDRVTSTDDAPLVSREELDMNITKPAEVDKTKDKSSLEDEVENRLTKVEEKADEGKAIARLLSDPNVRAVLDARQEGRRVKVVDFEESLKKTVIEDPDEKVDLDELTNEEFAKHMTKKLAHVVDTALDAKLKPVMNKVNDALSFAEEGRKTTVKTQIDKAKKKYDDFDDFQEQMVALNGQNPELTVEELYLVAKRREGGSRKAKTASEKPTTTASRVGKKVERDTPLARGRQGFEQLLNEAQDRVQLDIK